MKIMRRYYKLSGHDDNHRERLMYNPYLPGAYEFLSIVDTK